MTTSESARRGSCADCDRPMVDQREWRRNPAIRPGRVKLAGHHRCHACYMRGRRHGTLTKVTISARYPVHCDQCGPVGEATGRPEAKRIRAAHLATHGIRTAEFPLDDAEVARLRRMVGLAS